MSRPNRFTQKLEELRNKKADDTIVKKSGDSGRTQKGSSLKPLTVADSDKLGCITCEQLKDLVLEWTLLADPSLDTQKSSVRTAETVRSMFVKADEKRRQWKIEDEKREAKEWEAWSRNKDQFHMEAQRRQEEAYASRRARIEEYEERRRALSAQLQAKRLQTLEQTRMGRSTRQLLSFPAKRRPIKPRLDQGGRRSQCRLRLAPTDTENCHMAPSIPALHPNIPALHPSIPAPHPTIPALP
eukprot:CAMPEP_0118935560 /NCGR_PEP_ID=MMETSP1169-20130426/15709_1 /TAXON_ID=36882 /ORGANISM="Pyramimonas obovata, Strain CCMP722" /LENGTH=241 /DNA_ID=CAMNT_0006878611 /DNA_START=125 /DNA_END=848 /DNA_ORIENTATION=-